MGIYKNKNLYLLLPLVVTFLIFSSCSLNRTDGQPKCEGDAFHSIPSMKFSRSGHTMQLLNNGHVLIVGGDGNGANTAEIYEPKLHKYISVLKMNHFHPTHSSIKLKNGDILIIDEQPEIYDSSLKMFKMFAVKLPTIEKATAFYTQDGKVGVITRNHYPPNYMFFYDPKIRSFTPPKNLPVDYSDFNVVDLKNGKLLITGGYVRPNNKKNISANILASSLLFYPLQNKLSPISNMNSPRLNHQGTLLQNGSVFISGGQEGSQNGLFEEVYNPNSKMFIKIFSPSFQKTPWSDHQVFLLPKNQVLLFGTIEYEGGTRENSALIYSDNNHNFNAVGKTCDYRWKAATILLPNNELLITGGSVIKQSGELKHLKSAEYFEITTK